MEQSEQTTPPRGGSGLLLLTGMERPLMCKVAFVLLLSFISLALHIVYSLVD